MRAIVYTPIVEPLPRVTRPLDLGINGFVQGLDRPAHFFQYTKNDIILGTFSTNAGQPGAVALLPVNNDGTVIPRCARNDATFRFALSRPIDG